MWIDLIWTAFVYGLVFAVLWWGVGQLAGMIAEPFGKFARAFLVVGIVVVCIGILIGRVPIIPFGQIGTARL